MLITTAMLIAVQSANLTAASEAAEPPSDPCNGYYSCGPVRSNLGYFLDLPSPASCRAACDEMPLCRHFTYFKAGNLAGACFLFSSCERRGSLCGAACESGTRCSLCPACTATYFGDSSRRRRLNLLRAT